MITKFYIDVFADSDGSLFEDLQIIANNEEDAYERAYYTLATQEHITIQQAKEDFYCEIREIYLIGEQNG